MLLCCIRTLGKKLKEYMCIVCDVENRYDKSKYLSIHGNFCNVWILR